MLFRSDDIIAFHDINPVAPVHFMIVPKEHVASLAHVDATHQQVLGKIMVLANRLAKEQGCNDGFRIIVNTGRVARQDVFHLHVHIIGGGEVLPHMLYRPKAGT